MLRTQQQQCQLGAFLVSEKMMPRWEEVFTLKNILNCTFLNSKPNTWEEKILNYGKKWCLLATMLPMEELYTFLIAQSQILVQATHLVHPLRNASSKL